MIDEMAFKLGDPVLYQGKTYRFPGEVCAITDDRQIVVRAFGAPNGDYAGMKHIFGPSQLVPLALRPGSETDEAEFEVWQDDMPVASASGPRDRALAEAFHYATVYGQDGPVEVKEVVRTLVSLPSPPAMLAAAGGENG